MAVSGGHAALAKARRKQGKIHRQTQMGMEAISAAGDVATFAIGQSKKSKTAWDEYESGYKEFGGTETIERPKFGQKGFFKGPSGEVRIGGRMYDREQIQKAGSFLGSDSSAILDTVEGARTKYIEREKGKGRDMTAMERIRRTFTEEHKGVIPSSSLISRAGKFLVAGGAALDKGLDEGINKAFATGGSFLKGVGGIGSQLGKAFIDTSTDIVTGLPKAATGLIQGLGQFGTDVIGAGGKIVEGSLVAGGEITQDVSTEIGKGIKKSGISSAGQGLAQFGTDVIGAGGEIVEGSLSAIGDITKDVSTDISKARDKAKKDWEKFRYRATPEYWEEPVMKKYPVSLAKGGSFVTNGPQMIMVGDNPGGREAVNVVPLDSEGGKGYHGKKRNWLEALYANNKRRKKY